MYREHFLVIGDVSPWIGERAYSFSEDTDKHNSPHCEWGREVCIYKIAVGIEEEGVRYVWGIWENFLERGHLSWVCKDTGKWKRMTRLADGWTSLEVACIRKCDCRKWKSNVIGKVTGYNVSLLANDMKPYGNLKLELPQYASGLKYAFL